MQDQEKSDSYFTIHLAKCTYFFLWTVEDAVHFQSPSCIYLPTLLTWHDNMVLSLLTELANLHSWVSGKSPDPARAPITVQADRRLTKTWPSYPKNTQFSKLQVRYPLTKDDPTGLLWFKATEEKDLSLKLSGPKQMFSFR